MESMKAGHGVRCQ